MSPTYADEIREPRFGMGLEGLIRAKGARVLLVGMQLPPNYGRYAREFQQVFADTARQTKTPLVPFLLAGIADQPTLFQTDTIHPTAEAQPRMLDNVWPVLRPMLA